jgi:hypothetical protein
VKIPARREHVTHDKRGRSSGGITSAESSDGKPAQQKQRPVFDGPNVLNGNKNGKYLKGEGEQNGNEYEPPPKTKALN